MRNIVFICVLLAISFSKLIAQDVFQPSSNTNQPVNVTVGVPETSTNTPTASPTTTTNEPTASPTTTTNALRASPTTTTNAPSASASTKKDKIVIEYVDQDLSAVLRGLARRAGLNLVIGPGVAGTVTIRLTDVSFEDAIKIIVAAQGLNYTKDEVLNVSYVRTAASAIQEPTAPDSYTFNYAAAPEMVNLVRSVLKSGQIPTVDVRTNRIFYNEVVSNLDNAKKQIAELDMPTKQVMIEAKVMEVNNVLRQQWGVNWQNTFTGINIGGGLASSIAAGNVSGDILGGFINLMNPKNGNNAFSLLTPAQFSATINFFNNDAETRLLATPKLVVMDNRTATIDVNTLQNITFAVAAPAGSQTSTTAPPPFNAVAGSRLQISPRINNRNFITMRVTPTVTSYRPAPGADATTLITIRTVADNSLIQAILNPEVSTSTLETEVYIKSGNTLAIGGLSRGDQSNGKGKVPVLGDIPGLGYLFQSQDNARSDKEVMVFVTPTVIWDPSDLATRGIQRKNTGYENQFNKLAVEDEDLYANPEGWRNNAKGAFKIIDPDDKGKEKMVYDENGAFSYGPPPGSVEYPAWEKKMELYKKSQQTNKQKKTVIPKKTGTTSSSSMKTNPNNPSLATSKKTNTPAATSVNSSDSSQNSGSLSDQAKKNFSASESDLGEMTYTTPPTEPSTSGAGRNSANNTGTPAPRMKARAVLAPTPVTVTSPTPNTANSTESPIQAGPEQPPGFTGDEYVPTSNDGNVTPNTTPVSPVDNPNP